jgi:hypothetical protein
LIEQGVVVADRKMQASGEDAPPQPTVVELEHNARLARTYLLDQSRNAAARRYWQGLIYGALSSIALLVLLAVLVGPIIRWFTGEAATRLSYYVIRDLLLCLLGGAMGALLSVLVRLRVETIEPDVLRRDAFLRVALGWFFALGIFFLVKGEIVSFIPDPTRDLLATFEGADRAATNAETEVQLSRPSDTVIAQSMFFWAAIGVLAGFNERWVKGLLNRATQQPSVDNALLNGQEGHLREQDDGVQRSSG